MRYSYVIKHESENRIVKFLLVLKLFRGVLTYVRTYRRTDVWTDKKVVRGTLFLKSIVAEPTNFALAPTPEPGQNFPGYGSGCYSSI